MAHIYSGLEELIGHTPLVELSRLRSELQLPGRILAKLESANPAGSAKDRVALSMIETAEAEGKLNPDSVIIEPTSGNTGIGLSAVAAARGYRVIIVMPDTMSVERQLLMKAYGAELILSDGALGMPGCIARAEELAKEIPHALIAGQFVNPANPEAHYRSTGPEIWADTEGDVDIFVSAVGTGGTVTGTGRYLKEQKSTVRVVAVEPADSPVLSGGPAGPHKLQGIGAGFVPEILDTTLFDEILCVTAEDAYEATRLLARREGLLTGISSGAALSAAIRLASREENRDKTLVVLLPDTGERYLSAGVFG